VIPATLENVTQGELQRYKNNFNALNLIATALGRNVYDSVSHLKTAHDVWLKLCNTYEGSFEIKSLDDYFARFESIISILCSCGPLAYFDNERAKQLLYALYDSVWV
jgi:hypothetical protein